MNYLVNDQAIEKMLDLFLHKFYQHRRSPLLVKNCKLIFGVFWAKIVDHFETFNISS